ncbi:MAG: hypothetical protein ACLFOY_18980 [Desulfatibacillaceae bacterium]
MLSCNVPWQVKVLHGFMVLPPILLAAMGTLAMHWSLFALWIVLVLLYFAVLQPFFLCTHCPQYGKPGVFVTCLPFLPSPKLFAYEPGPMPLWKRGLMILCFVGMWVYGGVFLFLSEHFVTLAAYLLNLGALLLAARLFVCSGCVHFSCPMNAVDSDTRERFMEKNPELQKARGGRDVQRI